MMEHNVYNERVAQRRVNITIDAELHDEAKRVLAKLPRASFSALVEDSLREMVPVMASILEAHEEGGEDAALRAVESNIGRAVLGNTHGSRKGPKAP